MLGLIPQQCNCSGACGRDQRGQALSEGVYTYRYIVNNGDVKHGFLHLIR